MSALLPKNRNRFGRRIVEEAPGVVQPVPAKRSGQEQEPKGQNQGRLREGRREVEDQGQQR